MNVYLQLMACYLIFNIEIQKWFASFDKDSDGHLNTSEIVNALRKSYGINISESRLNSIIK